MMTVNQVSRLTGVSIRTLRYYDSIGLLKPKQHTESGYRLYDDAQLRRLQQILLFRELEFPLKEIQQIMDSPGFDKNRALEQQITLLTLKKEHLENLITYAKEIQKKGEINMNFQVFDKEKIKEYEKQAKEAWGGTAAYQEYEARNADRTPQKQQDIAADLMQLFAEFGRMRNLHPGDAAVQEKVGQLQAFITGHYYTCTKQILSCLGTMYTGDAFSENIDAAGGKGTAEFTAKAIEIFCTE